MCVSRERWEDKSRWWTRSGNTVLSQILTHPLGECERRRPSADLCCETLTPASDASVCAKCVNLSKWNHPCPWTCSAGRFFFFFPSYARVCLWVSAVLHYRVCLLFNRSAEEVTPQSMSQPSCIIAPLCHCQRLGRATSDCFSPPFLLLLPPPSLSFPLSPPSVFILIRLINLSCRDRWSGTEKEWAYWMHWRPTEKKMCVPFFFFFFYLRT